MRLPADNLRRRLASRPLAGALLCVVLALFMSPAGAVNYTVTKTADTNDGACNADCSLREAVIAANATALADTITVPAGVYVLTIPGIEGSALQGDLDILQPVDIVGAGTTSTIIDGGGLDRVFETYAPGISISGVTIRNGNASSNGGGLLNRSGSTLTLTDITVTGNTAGNRGGGLYAIGGAVTTINQSTFSGNSSSTEGGALSVNGTANLTNVTISGNATGGSGGGITNRANTTLTNVTLNANEADTLGGGGLGSNLYDPGVGTYNLTNVIVANGIGPANCSISTLTTDQNNLDSGNSCGFAGPLVNTNPLLGPLQYNGGPTQTHALLAGSPAIEGGTNSGCPATDQRGVARPAGVLCDVGAFEGTAYAIAGRVFEDADFAGTASGYDGGAGDQALSGVDVELYTSTDTYITSVVSDGSGNYVFYVVDGNYKVRARSATVGDSNTPPRGTFNGVCGITDPASGPGCVVAEQTWGNGAAVYGGQSATADDTATDNDAGPGDTWVPVTVSAADVTSVDFGFAYNLIVKTANIGQGSLRQFIDNANDIGAAGGTTANFSQFRIPTSDAGYNAGTGVFRITPVVTPLPAIADANTTIDGNTQTSNGGNTNTTVHGAGGVVGFDDLALSQVNGPEIEIRGQSGFAAGLRAAADNTIIRGLAIHGFGNGLGEGDIVIDNGVSGGTFEYNLLGSQAHTFADPAAAGAPRSRAGFACNGGDGWSLQHNLIGFGTHRGAYIVNASQNWSVQDNEFRDNSLVDIGGDNIAIDGNSSPGTISGNLIFGAASQGVVITGTTNNTVVNNTFTENGVGHTGAAPTQSGALTLRSTADNVTIDRNVFDRNYGPGVMINNGSIDNLITRNLFSDNGTILSRNSSPATGQIGIDLQLSTDNQDLGTSPFYNTNDNGDGDSGGNDIFNFAVIETAQIIGPNLVVSGYAASGATIEFFISDGDSSNFGEGKDFLFADTEGGAGDGDGGSGSYGPGAVNGVAQGDENPVPRYQFTVATASLPVPVTAADKLVATATFAGQTSEFSARAPVGAGTIAGTLFVDIVGDGLADGPIGPVPNPFVSGTRIELWLDGGDDIPDGGDDTYYSFTTSAPADGSYQFVGLGNGTYWVTVDAGGVNRGPYNGGYSGADAWAEQTYGPVGAATYDGVSWSFAPAAGAVYGGARWDQSDQFPPTNSLPTAEHIARVVVNDDDTTNVDFGFSFNVVTTTRGGSAAADPGVPPGQRTVQGSLRQFITNASAESGANPMRFVPAAPSNASNGGHTWWQIPVTAALPQVLDVTTTIDGAAFDAADGVTPLDTNTAAIGSGAAVGVSGTFNTPQLDPELELRGDGVVNLGLDVQPDADGSAVRNVAINAFTINAMRLIGSLPNDLANVTVENVVIGTSPASFTDVPALSTGRGLFGRDLSNATLRNNLVGWVDWGLQVQFDTVDSLIETNEIRGCTTYGIYLGGVAGTGQQPARVTMRGNLVEQSGNQGINTQQSLNQLTIDENTVRLTGGHGVRAYGIQNTITGNIIADNSGTGLLVIGDNLPGYPAASQNRISQNQFGNNSGLAIDLVANGVNADGITLNDDLDGDTGGANELHNFPVIESAILAAGNLTVTGYARPGAEIEFYEAVGAANDQNGGGTAHGEGIDYLFSATEGTGADTDAATGSYASPDYGTDTAANRFRFVVPAPAGLALGEELSAISIDTTNDTSEFGPNATVNPPYTIVKRAFMPDGTPLGDGTAVPVGVEFKWLLYINNSDGATNDASIRDVLDPLFAYQAGTLQVDNSVAGCAAAACTPAEEAAIFTAVAATAFLTDVVDGDVASYNGTDTIDAGNQNVANGQLNVGANSVLALLFSAKVQ